MLNHKVLIIGASQYELSKDSRLSNFTKLVFNMMPDQLFGFNEIGQLPRPIQHEFHFNEKDVIDNNQIHFKNYYKKFLDKNSSFKNKFEFIMIDRMTLHCLDYPLTKIPECKEDWAMVAKNGIYNYINQSYNPNIVKQIFYWQMYYLIINFLKSNGSFLCAQKKSYGDQPLFKDLFRSFRILQNNELELLNDCQNNDNLWFLYNDLDNSWKCIRCTFINDQIMPYCEMCNNLKNL